jgi:DNA recombination protein RmuC
MTTQVWLGGITVGVLAVLVGWLLRGLVERPRVTAERAVHAERVGRLEAELAAARTEAAAHGQAPAQVAEAMAPVQVSLERLEGAVARVAGGQSSGTAQLAEQLKAVASLTTASSEGLRRETARLVGALGHSEVRGRWGEFQLRRLLETSGLVRGVHFTEQASVSTDDGRLRPDALLHLGPDKTVVVDAKVSLRAILTIAADDPADEVAAARAAHAREVRNHVDRLASKEYARQFDTAPEFVVMFLPAESLLAEALACDHALLEHAFARNVVLASPTTFMALTRTVAHMWRQDVLAQNAQEIQSLGRELADRLAVMVGHLDRLGTSLGSSVAAYNRTIASLESRVLVTGRRFAALQGLAEPTGPDQVEGTPRAVGSGVTASFGAAGGGAVIDMGGRDAQVVDVGA